VFDPMAVIAKGYNSSFWQCASKAIAVGGGNTAINDRGFAGNPLVSAKKRV
jgi:hypothetical protein